MFHAIKHNLNKLFSNLWFEKTRETEWEGRYTVMVCVNFHGDISGGKKKPT